ncbi:MAG: TraX family protein [Eubacteriales bacterium]|nr:TraX family protein [Eubacteriales bacterium]
MKSVLGGRLEERGHGPFLSREAVKYIAIFTMTLNHAAHCFLQQGTFWYQLLVGLGYFTAPVMCCFLTEGFAHTRSRKKYALRLLAFALISQYPFALAFPGETGTLNMIFTLFLCLCLLMAMERLEGSLLRLPVILGLTALTAMGDWGIVAPLMVYEFQGARGDQKKTGVVFGAVSAFAAVNEVALGLEAGAGLFRSLLYGLFSGAGPFLAGVVVLFLYDQKKAPRGGRFSKWFFYVYYPAHLLALGLLSRF